MEQLGFISIMRVPDGVQGALETSQYRFEEKVNRQPSPVPYTFEVTDTGCKVVIHPGSDPVCLLKLRWRGDLSRVEAVMGDDWERVGATYCPLEWRSVMPHRPLPWFCYLRQGDGLACYGVKTGSNCFAFFQVDSHGITLMLNLMSGAKGTHVKESFVACEIVESVSQGNENAFMTAKRFMGMLCENPVMPKSPIFGTNNWYWAYGNISRESVLQETVYLQEMTDGVQNRPSLIIDDGWQINRSASPNAYIGGPFSHSNARFPDMGEMAQRIAESGAKPGLWFRPLQTLGVAPSEAKLYNEVGGFILDPSHPYTLERVREDAARIRDWGYEIIKHDFTTNDIFNTSPCSVHQNLFPMAGTGTVFHDNTRTTAMIIKDLYKAIQAGARDADVIGCSVVGHLSAGIHSIHRVGDDTSGRSFEWTARNGVHSLMRLPMNGTFFQVDPDCAAFTDRVNPDKNLDFMELCALTGVTTLASVTPGSLSDVAMKRINEIYRMADRGNGSGQILDFARCAIPERIGTPEGIKTFDWSDEYDGSRVQLNWMD